MYWYSGALQYLGVLLLWWVDTLILLCHGGLVLVICVHTLTICIKYFLTIFTIPGSRNVIAHLEIIEMVDKCNIDLWCWIVTALFLYDLVLWCFDLMFSTWVLCCFLLAIYLEQVKFIWALEQEMQMSLNLPGSIELWTQLWTTYFVLYV